MLSTANGSNSIKWKQNRPQNGRQMELNGSKLDIWILIAKTTFCIKNTPHCI